MKGRWSRDPAVDREGEGRREAVTEVYRCKRLYVSGRGGVRDGDEQLVEEAEVTRWE